MPPEGSFVEVDGVRLHYVDRGSGRPVVLLHGNGVTLQDFEASGLLELASQHYRVIAFDRPGFGYSERPRTTIWTPAAQARLIAKALSKLGVGPAVFVGHSWGTLVALALALDEPAQCPACFSYRAIIMEPRGLMSGHSRCRPFLLSAMHWPTQSLRWQVA